MPRKPNYSFERRERERMKAEKKARRTAEKKEARENKAQVVDPSEVDREQKSEFPTGE